jgi:putative N6-adenine-specific DNA methylase
MEKQKYFATTSKGLEETLAGEIVALGGEGISAVTGGVAFSGDADLGMRANLWLRTANRVLRHLSDFDAPTPEALYDGVKAIPWPDLFAVSRTIAVDATVRDSGITHSHFAAQKAKDAVVDAFRDRCGSRPDVDRLSAQVRINLRIVRDEAVLSVDLSGESLNRRGYRTDPAAASLRETLAAGILLLAEYDGEQPLVDPACGAGTLPIEAALIASNSAPGLLRDDFGFKNLLDFVPKRWTRLVDEARGAVQMRRMAPISGYDLSTVSINDARCNARNAGFADRISFSARDVAALAPEGAPGLIVCNPPYGVRLKGGDAGIEPFYAAFGKVLKDHCGGWTAWILSGNAEATRALKLKTSRRIPLMNGPIDCRLLRYDLRA